MRTFLKSLSQFEVKLSLDRESFLKKANLTKAEKVYLTDHLASLEITHRFTFNENEEMMLFCIEILRIDDQYTEERVVRTIASALPYACIVAVKSGYSVGLWLPEKKDNTRNGGRSVITHCNHSPRFSLVKENSVHVRMRTALNTAILHRGSVFEASVSLRVAFYDAFECLRKVFVDEDYRFEESDLENWKELACYKKTEFGYAVVGPIEREVMYEILNDEDRLADSVFDGDMGDDIEDYYD